MAVSLKENNCFFVMDQTPHPYPTRSLISFQGGISTKGNKNTLYTIKGQSWTGWPHWANFRSIGDCLLWAIMYLKITKVSNLFGLLYYSTVDLMR
jgi:hypothetical protein